ncbi:YpmS family protein [Alkalicoccus chagannorensis]|uniref:YpmS family protein n=1 Tax=Alkalicoccus chagannorensis TaxID=427072 RepID=UPI00041747FA|nr:YpmS family protein [Alkalicoccus chagannorensis]
MNVWKIAFFSLLGLIVLTVAGGWLWLQAQMPDEEAATFEAPEPETVEGPSFLVQASTEDANAWLQRELEEENGEDFDLYLDEQVHFQTSVAAFGIDVPIEIDFEPEMADGGNLWLREDGFRLGFIELPADQVFQLIGDNIDLPDFMTLDAAEASLYIDLREFDTDNYIIQAEDIDLRGEGIELSITAS